MTKLHTSQGPGRRERHLLRKRNNPLFPASQRTLTQGELTEAQRLDHEELVAFITRFRGLVQEVATLEPNIGSEVIMELKERLDRCYEQAAGVADDQSDTRDAIRRLLLLTMDAVRRGAGDDATALSELDQEQAAREAHCALLQHPLVADLLAPDSPIKGDELAATLLSAAGEEFEAALSLFDPGQLSLLCQDARELLRHPGEAPAEAHRRLQEMERLIG